MPAAIAMFFIETETIIAIESSLFLNLLDINPHKIIIAKSWINASINSFKNKILFVLLKLILLNAVPNNIKINDPRRIKFKIAPFFLINGFIFVLYLYNIYDINIGSGNISNMSLKIKYVEIGKSGPTKIFNIIGIAIGDNIIDDKSIEYESSFFPFSIFVKNGATSAVGVNAEKTTPYIY